MKENREEEYQRKVKMQPGYLEKKRAIAEKLREFGIIAEVPDAGDSIAQPPIKSTEEQKSELKEFSSNIKERRIDEPIISEEVDDFREEPKKISKFKMRQMKNKQ